MPYDLEFEKPLAELDKKIKALQKKSTHLKAQEQEQLAKAEQDLATLTEDIYNHLTDWQTVQVARHKDRPHAIDYLHLMCDDFFTLHGDRQFGDNATILGGPATFGKQTVMFLCHEKGRTRKEQRDYNAGQARPEGFRKAQRLMEQAEKFGFPLICLVDTPGASISLEDEERGQGTAIATSLFKMSQLRVPIISVVIGEGGSGGALALAVADRLLMLEHSYFAVAAPESVAIITWRNVKFAHLAAEGQQTSARSLYRLGLIDALIPEPPGAAHRDYQTMASTLKTTLLQELEALQQVSSADLLSKRYQKYRSIGELGLVR